jgi:hypothetical protein
MFGTDDWRDLKNHYEKGYGPEIRYTPFDAVELDRVDGGSRLALFQSER